MKKLINNMFKVKVNVDFSWNEKVSSVLAIILVVLLSILIARLTLMAANKIIDGANDSQLYNVQNRSQYEESR